MTLDLISPGLVTGRLIDIIKNGASNHVEGVKLLGTKIVGEALPALWLQITLLSLTLESATAKTPAVTFVSLCCTLAA